MSHTRFVTVGALAVFLVIFNIAYVFHDLLLGAWFHEQEPFARDHFIVPLIGLAFAVYAIIAAHLFPMYRNFYAERSLPFVGLTFGLIMGVLFDALQGGIIEYATFQQPLAVFFVDSGYHVFVEGSMVGLILAAVYRKQQGRTQNI